jgi:hypothetical protein
VRDVAAGVILGKWLFIRGLEDANAFLASIAQKV